MMVGDRIKFGWIRKGRVYISETVQYRKLILDRDISLGCRCAV